jgi:hypothetical protein
VLAVSATYGIRFISGECRLLNADAVLKRNASPVLGRFFRVPDLHEEHDIRDCLVDNLWTN